LFLPEPFARRIIHSHPLDGPEWSGLRKFIAFDEGTLGTLTGLRARGW
jgi:hypothetical protein